MGRRIMNTEAQHLRLLTWLSPAFPVGAFGYSHGLETAIREGVVTDADALSTWIAGLIEHGSGWTDAVLFKAAHAAASDPVTLADITELAAALAPSLERRRESLGQGEAFLIAAHAWGPQPLNGAVAYCAAVGAACGAAGITPETALIAWLHAFAANLVSVAVRAIPIGQTDGVAVIAGLEPIILDAVARAVKSSLDDLGSATMLSDIAAMRHETLGVRLFIS
jgi:urease accessory protein